MTAQIRCGHCGGTHGSVDEVRQCSGFGASSDRAAQRAHALSQVSPRSGKAAQARRMARSQTPPERLLWTRLRNGRLGGWLFKRQHIIRGYIVDFYCSDARLVVEVDGTTHDKQYSAARDQLRDEVLRANYYRVLRVPARRVFNELDVVLGEILEAADVPAARRRRAARKRSRHRWPELDPMGRRIISRFDMPEGFRSRWRQRPTGRSSP